MDIEIKLPLICELEVKMNAYLINVFNLQILTPSEYFRSFFFLSIEIFENKDFAFEYMNIYVLNNNF